jgi:hypothetical protein
VGAGIASVEVNRRWQAYRESAETQKLLQNRQQDSKEKEAQPEALLMAEYRPEASVIDLSALDEVIRSQSITAPDAVPEAPDIPIETPVQIVDPTQLGLPQLTSPDQTTVTGADLEKLNLSQADHENNSVQLGASRFSSQSAAQNVDLAESKILESRKQYQTCRINVPI